MRSLCVQCVFVWESLWFWEMVKHFHFAGNWIIFYKLIRAREQAYGFLWMQKRGQLCIKQMFVCTLRHDARCFLSIFRSINLSLIVFVYKFDEWTEFRTNSTNEWIFLTVTFFQRWIFFQRWPSNTRMWRIIMRRFEEITVKTASKKQLRRKIFMICAIYWYKQQ